MKILKLLPMLLLLTMASCNKQQYDIFTTLTGTVTDETTGEPITAATVTLSPGGKSSITGADGVFEFVNVDAVQYSVMAQKSGYSTNRTRVTGIAGETVMINLTLKPIEQSK